MFGDWNNTLTHGKESGIPSVVKSFATFFCLLLLCWFLFVVLGMGPRGLEHALKYRPLPQVDPIQ